MKIKRIDDILSLIFSPSGIKINPINRALKLRETLEKDGKILVAEFKDTLQGKDTSKVVDLMPNVATGEYVFRTKVNIKEIDPIATEIYGKEYKDVSKMKDGQIEDLVKRAEFDFPLWFKHDKNFDMKKVADYNLPFIVQVAGCNFHNGSEIGGCLYCFVDNESNDGKIVEKGKTFLSVNDTVGSLEKAKEKVREIYRGEGIDLDLKVVRTSGGEPTLTLDYILGLWREIEKRGLDLVGQLDSNLSTGQVVERFEQEGIYEKDILEKLAEYPIKILTAIKGTDERNLQSNVQAATGMANQKYSLKKFLRSGFDIYPQMYNPNPMSLWNYLEDMEKEIKNFALRVHIGPLKLYGPTKKRLEALFKFHMAKMLDNPKSYFESPKFESEHNYFVATLKNQWDLNYEHGSNIMDKFLRKRHGVGYGEIVRSDVKLKVIS